jgi:hypothetical protein
MPSRRKLLTIGGPSLLAIICLAAVVLVGHPSIAQAPPRGPVLKERLLVGLRVKTASDKRFIARVVELVEQRKLPLKLVDTTYFWARAKATRHRSLANNPMVYFRPALVARAAKLGIRI